MKDLKKENCRETILIVDDEDGIRYGLRHLFEKNGSLVFDSGDAEQAVEIFKKENIRLAIIDIKLKNDYSGIELMRSFKKIEPDVICILITGYGSIDNAVKAMKEGASDYILKPIDNENLLAVVRKNLEIAALKDDNRFLKTELLNTKYSKEFITNAPKIKAMQEIADRIKNTNTSILINGESGTGKEVFAQYIHFTSNRRDFNFVGINCAAISEELLQSELFGHEKGSFTGAHEKKAGKFEVAHKGTLFLDEIGDMSLTIQAKLLRVLEEGCFERVGSVKRINVDFRLIAATNKDLQKQIREGKFREDLFYRINVVRFLLPSLRERKDDIPLLVRAFTKKYSERYNLKVADIPQSVMEALTAYRWPGNIRELQNVINQSVLLSDGEELSLHGFEPDLFLETEKRETERVILPKEPDIKKTVSGLTEQCEKQMIQDTLIKTGGNKSRASRILGITRKTLAKKMHKYHILSADENY